MTIDGVKLLIRFLPVHSIVIFTLIGLLMYRAVKNQKVKTAFLIFWSLLFASLYGHPVFVIFSLAITFVVYLLAILLIRFNNLSVSAARKDVKEDTSVSKQNYIMILKKVLLIVGIIISLGSLALFKYPVLKSHLPLSLQVKALGISYFTFKFLHVLIDTYRGRLKELDFLTFFAFIFFFPTFSAGPIDRYPRFKRNMDEVQARTNSKKTPSDDYKESEKESVDIGISRIIYGLFKKFIIADKTGILIAKIAPDILDTPRHILWIVVFLYSIRIYYDFSGYSDIAIGLGRLFGFKVPENFNKPYLKPNIVLFWQNWHITLTSWLREYLFMPMGKMLMGFMGTGHAWIINSVCQLITMAAVGIWHGSTAGFLIWGLYHGAGLSLYKIYTDLIKRYGSEKLLDMLEKSKAFYYTNIFLTFVFVSIGWVFFSFRWTTAFRIVLRMFGI